MQDFQSVINSGAPSAKPVSALQQLHADASSLVERMNKVRMRLSDLCDRTFGSLPEPGEQVGQPRPQRFSASLGEVEGQLHYMAINLDAIEDLATQLERIA